MSNVAPPKNKVGRSLVRNASMGKHQAYKKSHVDMHSRPLALLSSKLFSDLIRDIPKTHHCVSSAPQNGAPVYFQCISVGLSGFGALDFIQQALQGLCLASERCTRSMASKVHSTLVRNVSILAKKP